MTSMDLQSIWLDRSKYADAERDYVLTDLGGGFLCKIQKVEAENKDLKKSVNDLKAQVTKLANRVEALESGAKVAGAAEPKAKAQQPKTEAKDDDDDVDLFASDDEVDAEAEEARKKRLEEYAQKKAKKPGPIAKSNIILDVKPWDDETDLQEMEKAVRSIEKDGLLWGVSKFVPVAFNIKKLTIVCVVEDEKVSVDELVETIQEFEDFVQSVDIAAFQKI